jgi:hypothetical protein
MEPRAALNAELLLAYSNKSITVVTAVSKAKCLLKSLNYLSLSEQLGNVVCSNCSDQKHALQKFGYDK